METYKMTTQKEWGYIWKNRTDRRRRKQKMEMYIMYMDMGGIGSIRGHLTYVPDKTKTSNIHCTYCQKRCGDMGKLKKTYIPE